MRGHRRETDLALRWAFEGVKNPDSPGCAADRGWDVLMKSPAQPDQPGQQVGDQPRQVQAPEVRPQRSPRISVDRNGPGYVPRGQSGRYDAAGGLIPLYRSAGLSCGLVVTF